MWQLRIADTSKLSPFLIARLSLICHLMFTVLCIPFIRYVANLVVVMISMMIPPLYCIIGIDVMIWKEETCGSTASIIHAMVSAVALGAYVTVGVVFTHFVKPRSPVCHVLYVIIVDE